MVRPDKAAAVAELTEAFRGSSAAVLTEYRGLTVAELKELRRSLAGNATYAVVKNTLTKIAAREAGIEQVRVVAPRPVGDRLRLRRRGRGGEGAAQLRPRAPAADRQGRHPRRQAADRADEIRRLADLESREVLLAKFAGGMLAPAQQLVTVLAAPMAQLARLFGALEAKLAADPQQRLPAATARRRRRARGSCRGEPAAEPTRRTEPEAGRRA